MENSSKALIIAGAILVAILLISVGIIVMNSANKPLNEAKNEADSQAVQMYNSKLINYAGNKKSAKEVSSLMDLVSTLTGKDIILTYANITNLTNSGAPWKHATVQSYLDDKKTYKVSMGTNENRPSNFQDPSSQEYLKNYKAKAGTGYISWIYIEED